MKLLYKKSNVYIIFLLLIILFVSSCSNTLDSSYEEKLAYTLSKRIDFEYDLSEHSIKELKSVLINDIDIPHKSVFYLSDFGCADMILVMTCDSKADVNNLLHIIKTNIQSLKKQYEYFSPGECDKIDNTIYVLSNNTLIICITSDYNAAKSVIDEVIMHPENMENKLEK